MARTQQRRLINPRLGIYFSIFASGFSGLVVMLLILDQLGTPQGLIRLSMLVLPLAAFAGIAVCAYCQEPAEFFAAGRRVPAVYAGLVLAGSAVGSTGTVAITGLFFINGHDAWCLAIGFSAGFVVMALMIAPYMRKLGAYTVPSYLGRRFDSRLLRLTSAAIVAAPMLLVIVAELKMGAWAARWLTGFSEPSMMLLIASLAMLTVAVGGTRSLTWTNVAQAIAAFLALLIPVAVVAALVTNLPLPQLSHGPVLRGISRMESMQGVPIAIAPALAFDLAGQGLSQLTHRIAAPYTSVGPISFILASLTLMCGIAGAPWLLPRLTTTPGVYATRKAIGWATLLCGLTLLTAASVAVFMRVYVMDTVVDHRPSELPDWFRAMAAAGMARADVGVDRLALANLSFDRDAVLFMLPTAAGFPPVVLFMALAGAIAAALLAASSGMSALGNVLAEDGINGLMWDPSPPPLAVGAARLGAIAVGVAALLTAVLIPHDPLQLLIWALAISASSTFPVLAMSVWWKRLNAFGAVVGMGTGFGVAILAILAGEAAWLGVPSELAAVFAVPASLVAAVAASLATPAPGRHVLDVVREIRLPGGETLHDRETRRARMKQRTPA